MEKKTQIRDAAFNLAISEGWRWVTFSKIAQKTNLEETEIAKLFSSKQDIFLSLVEEIDEITLSESHFGGSSSIRDRLFDIIMTRFDKLLPYRHQIKSILFDFSQNPLAISNLIKKNMNSMKLMLEFAEVKTSGLTGRLNIKGLMIIYAIVFRIWLNDDSVDLSKTMAALDSNLGKAESIASVLQN